MVLLLSIEKNYLNKIKSLEEKKFYLRKVIYEFNRLSYDKGTRKGDYLIREKINEINYELDIYDNKIRTYDIKSRDKLLIYRDIILFFEERFLDQNILDLKINTLKEELKSQENADAEHNARHKNESYERSTYNIYRNDGFVKIVKKCQMSNLQ